MYKGDNCDIIDLTPVNAIVIGSMVIFKWPRPPHLDRYSFVYHHLGDNVIYEHSIIMADDDTSALVGNLRDGIADYRICVEKQDVAQSHDFITINGGGYQLS
jgi:hypothetical protein